MLERQVMRSKSQVLVTGLCWRCYFLKKVRVHPSQTFEFALTKRTRHGSGENQISIFDKTEKSMVARRLQHACHDALPFHRIVVIETHEHAGDFKECSSPCTCTKRPRSLSRSGVIRTSDARAAQHNINIRR